MTPRLRIWLASRTARNLALAALALLLLLRIPYAGVHMGLARDFFAAYRIVHGDEFPPYGPVLNETIHLGPVWFYLLALLLAVGRTWLSTLLLLGAVAALQVPLAYLLGKALHGRRAGLLFAVGLLVPSWSTFEWLLPSHPLLSPALDLAFLLCAVRYCRRPRTRYLVGMALFGVLAIHAHPANAGLLWVAPAVAAWAWRRGVLRARDVLLAAAAALLPLLPFLWWDFTHGFAEWKRAGAYLGNGRTTGSVFDLARLFAGVAWGGAREWFEPTLGWPAPWAGLATLTVAAGGAAGALGLVAGLRDARTRRVVLCGLATLLAVLLTTVLVRVDTPYYMAASTWIVLAGLVAIGLASLGETRAAHAVRVCAAAVALAACAVTIAGTARFQAQGTWAFEWVPWFDIKRPRDGQLQILPLMPAYAQRASGKFLCAQPAPAVHGVYAAQLTSDHAIAMRLFCDRGDVHIGGNAPDREHWLGLSRAMLAHVGVRPARRIGPLGLVPARPVGDTPPLLPPDVPVYPAQVPPPASAHSRVPAFRLAASEHLAVTHMAYALAEKPAIVVRMDGRPVAPAFEDGFVSVYACDCARGASAEVDIEMRGGNSRGVDLAVF
ncbi:hypothetical protein [Dokdonella ginsengisoli]|uniref:Glycosyltransferase RgtA/B/C/D-like domain-containing protein n=1 Tax=Dokdonella ginsengisoli TaxID=363846 RepID=A0ABV9QVL3_9GAMM